MNQIGISDLNRRHYRGRVHWRQKEQRRWRLAEARYEQPSVLHENQRADGSVLLLAVLLCIIDPKL